MYNYKLIEVTRVDNGYIVKTEGDHHQSLVCMNTGEVLTALAECLDRDDKFHKAEKDKNK